MAPLSDYVTVSAESVLVRLIDDRRTTELSVGDDC